MMYSLIALITTSLEIDIALFIGLATLGMIGAVLCFKINKFWGRRVQFWTLISLGFVCLTTSRFILIIYKLNGYGSDIFTNIIVFLGFLFFILGLGLLYKTLKRGFK